MIVMHETKKIELTPEKLADAAAVLLALGATAMFLILIRAGKDRKR